MKLTSNKTREYGDKSYYKHWVVIPQKLIDELQWEKGDDLKADVKNGRLIIQKN